MQSNLSRRSVVSSGAIAAVAIIAPSVAQARPSREAEALWAELKRLQELERLNSAACQAARDRLPAWAREGHEMVNGLGEPCGAIVGWPEMRNPQKPKDPSRNVFMLVRPSPYSIRSDWKRAVIIHELEKPGNAHVRPRFRALYRRRMVEVVSRLRERRAEEASVGLPWLYAESERIAALFTAHEDSLRELAERGDIYALAAFIMCQRADLWWRVTQTILKSLRPNLTGQIARDVDQVLIEIEQDFEEQIEA